MIYEMLNIEERRIGPIRLAILTGILVPVLK